MSTIFLVLFLLSVPTLMVGLIKPSILKLQSRKLVGLVFGTTFLVSFILFGMTVPTSEVKTVAEDQTQGTVEIVTATTTPPQTSSSTKEKVDTTKVTSAQPAVTTPKAESQYTYYSITGVVDGDTVKVNINGTVETLRLIGLDTPETVDPRKPVQCFGKEASNKAKELLIGKKVRIEKDPTQGEKDKYNRTLAYIYLESGIFYNKYMIEQGYAHEYTYNTPYKYQAEFKQAQKTAEANKVGLWSPNTCDGVTNQTETTATPPAMQTSGRYYTSSASNATRYYPNTCSAWQDLSKSNLRSFNSLDELLATYPKRTLAESCK
jgi:endonuclease YncB( thermonuclease family)